MRVALVHDYLTQRGGAERVVGALARSFPDAPIHTSFYDPAGTFPQFRQSAIRPSPLDAVTILRRSHRLALPLLATAFSRLHITADVVVCSSSGWAHGARVEGRKIVYCHTPARWLYQPERYLRGRSVALRGLSAALRPALMRWDKAAAASADLYVANSSVVARRIAEVYGIEAEVLSPPPALGPDRLSTAVEGIEPGFALCVSRLLPYKNVDAVVRAFADLPGERLVVAGAGPDEAALRALATPNVVFVGRVDDEQLRWLYRESSLLVAASYEDFGLTPLEAASFGKPAAVLRWGGFLDTVAPDTTGIFFETPMPNAIAGAVRDCLERRWDADAIRTHADRFSEQRFMERIRAIVGWTPGPADRRASSPLPEMGGDLLGGA